MQKEQPTEPDPPRAPDFAVNFRNLPSYSASVSFNGRRSVFLSRLIRPLGRLMFGWLEWCGSAMAKVSVLLEEKE